MIEALRRRSYKYLIFSLETHGGWILIFTELVL